MSPRLHKAMARAVLKSLDNEWHDSGVERGYGGGPAFSLSLLALRLNKNDFFYSVIENTEFCHNY